MQGKRGLSAIITTLIIILLVLVAVGGIWVVVNNFIKTGSEEIELGKFTLDLEIKSVQVDGDDITVTVVVRRNPGKGNLVGMNFVFSDGRESEVIREETVLEELEEKTFTFILTKISGSDLKDVSVAPIYESSSGKEEAGNVADMFEIKKIASSGGIGGSGGGGVVGNFEALGYVGAGIKNYSISSGGTNLPEFRRAIVDPLDVLSGQNQTFIVHVYSPNNITNVTSVTELDNSTSNLIFLKISEYLEGSENIEIWDVTWVVNDVHAVTYRTTITATDLVGNENSLELSWTDSCQSQITHGGDDAIATTCSTTVNEVSGLDGGNLVVNLDRTLTISSGSIWVFNSGNTITVTGTIAMSGGNISKTTLHYADVDSDGYGDEGGALTFGSGGVRAKDSSGDDCYDSNSNVHPGQTSYFTSHRGDGSFDYNCVGGNQKQYTGTLGICKDCDFDGGEPGLCDPGATAGVIGYTASSTPACGSSANYIDNVGSFCSSRSAPLSVNCEDNALAGCTTISRTQACR